MQIIYYVRLVGLLFRDSVLSLCYEKLGDCQRKRQGRYQKLPKNDHYMTNNFKQSDLHHSSALYGLQHTAEESECQAHRVQTVHVVCCSKSAALGDGS